MIGLSAMSGQVICGIDELQGELCTRGFTLAVGGEDKQIFIVKKAGSYYAYLNSCPHAGVPLNWERDKFLSYDERYLQCSLHGAMFRMEDGVCIAGPCPGAALTSVPVKVEAGQLLLCSS